MSSNKTRIEKIIDQINATNAKKIALFLVIGFVCYHGILHVYYGNNSCKWLLSDGRYKGDQEWQPFGCMLHLYSKIDTRKCLRYLAFYGTHTHFIFIGDARMKQLYTSFLSQLLDESPVRSGTSTNLTHIDHKLKLQVEFYPAPLINNLMVGKFHHWQKSKDPPSVIVIGCTLDAIRASNGSKVALEEFKMNLTHLVHPIGELSKRKSRVLWALQEPVAEEGETDGVTNEIVDAYNRGVEEVLYYSKTELWRSFRLVEGGQKLKGGAKALQHNTQILLNMYCNDYMNFNDGTCCSTNEPYTTLQIVTFVTLSLCVLVALIMLLHRAWSKFRGHPVHKYSRIPDNELDVPNHQQEGYFPLFIHLAKIALIMSYFLVCDRTNFFMKENKYYSEFSFWLPIGYIMVLGLFFTDSSEYTKVLHRGQLTEWKGWMLLVILVYHITGANRIVPINMHVKVLISSFLFLLGYEQFTSVWQRGNNGIVDFFRTLFRLNFMTVTLCLCMNRPYQFYYFVPLLSFWYLVISIFLAFPPHFTAQNLALDNNLRWFYLLLKFIVLFLLITILFLSEVFFEKVFVTRPWKALFVTTDDDIREWWFRWKLDRYSIMYGMCFAVILILAKKSNFYDDNNHGNLFSRGIGITSILGAIIAIASYLTLTVLCHDESECSEIHSYVVFLPIVGYIVLRNISGMLRTRYSSLFAWFGEISLELFISQYHIWLAADTHGVLVLIPGYPNLNVIVTTFIFVCASHEVHRLTLALLPYAVPGDWKLVLRNFILFLAILVPIGINDGMF